MRGPHLALLLGVALLLGACGQHQSTSGNARTTTPPDSALAPPVTAGAPAATPGQQQAAGLVPSQPAKARRANEDGSETVEETAGDSGSHNTLLAAVASTMAAATPTAVAATATSGPTLWQEGVNYTRLVPAQPTSVGAGQVEVLEFFWYGCPHCYAIDPSIESWRKTKPGFITFARVPVMWSEGHRSTARLYYTLESMGKLDQLHTEVFKEIHVNNDPLIAADPNDAAGAERLQTAFVGKFGIPEDAFKKAYHSFAVGNRPAAGRSTRAALPNRGRSNICSERQVRCRRTFCGKPGAPARAGERSGGARTPALSACGPWSFTRVVVTVGGSASR